MPTDHENLCVWLKGLSQIEVALSEFGASGESYDEASLVVGELLGQLSHSAACMEEHADA